VGNGRRGRLPHLLQHRGSAAETLVVLNAGPGVGQEYLRRLEELADAGRQVVFYDQLGNGRSDAPYRWTVAQFVDELEPSAGSSTSAGCTRTASRGAAAWHCGTTWITLRTSRAPWLSNTSASIPLAYAEMHRLRRELCPAAFAAMLKHEADGTINSADDQQLVTELYIRHLRRATPRSRERLLAGVGRAGTADRR
jgi:L-proline amide hydrolase